MNVQLVDSLTELCMLKHAAEAAFENDEIADPTQDERHRKLRTGLLALGALAAGGAAAWALSGPAGAAIGRGLSSMTGNDNPSLGLTNPVAQGLGTAGTLSAHRFLKSKEDAVLPKTPSPEAPGKVQQIAENAVARVFPSNAPNKIVKDIGKIEDSATTAEKGSFLKKLVTPSLPAEANTSLGSLRNLIAEQNKAPAKEEGEAKGAPKANENSLEGFKRTLLSVQQNPSQNRLVGTYTGIHTNDAGSPGSLEALNSGTPQQILETLATKGVITREFDPSTGKIVQTTVGLHGADPSGALDVQSRAHNAQTAVLPRDVSALRTTETYLSKQQGLSDLLGVEHKLSSLVVPMNKGLVALPGMNQAASAQALDNSLKAVRNEIANRVAHGSYVESGRALPSNQTPGRPDTENVLRRAEAYKQLSSALHTARYAPGAYGTNYLRGGIVPGAAVGLGSYALQHWLPTSAPWSK